MIKVKIHVLEDYDCGSINVKKIIKLLLITSRPNATSLAPRAEISFLAARNIL